MWYYYTLIIKFKISKLFTNINSKWAVLIDTKIQAPDRLKTTFQKGWHKQKTKRSSIITSFQSEIF